MPEPKTLEEALEAELNTIQSTISSFPTPADALYHLVNWHVAATIDPVVNGGKVLVELSTLQNLEKLQTFMKEQGIPTIAVETSPDRTISPDSPFFKIGVPGE